MCDCQREIDNLRKRLNEEVENNHKKSKLINKMKQNEFIKHRNCLDVCFYISSFFKKINGDICIDGAWWLIRGYPLGIHEKIVIKKKDIVKWEQLDV